MRSLSPTYVLVLILLGVSVHGAPQYWVQQALDYQNAIQENMPLNEKIFVMSHNSYSYPKANYSGPPLHRPPPSLLNQVMPIADQLDYGVRIVNLDAHYLDELPAPPKLYACHTSHPVYDACYGPSGTPEERLFCSLAGMENYGNDTGCWPGGWDGTFKAGMQEIAAWMQANPNEFILLEIEWDPCTACGDNVPAAEAELFEGITSSFVQSQIYAPKDKVTPTWPTTAQLLADGKRIMIYGGPLNDTLTFSSITSYHITYPDEWVSAFKGYPTCATTGPTLPKDQYINIAEDSTHFLSAIDGPGTVGLFTNVTVSQVLACGLSTAVDRIASQKALMFVWSWQVDEPKYLVSQPPSTNCAYLDGSVDGRWYTQPCANQVLSFACMSSVDKYDWRLSSTAGLGTSASGCPAGYSFAAPVNAAQNMVLRNATGNQRVWISAVVNQVALPPAPPPPPTGEIIPAAPEPAPEPTAPRDPPQVPRFCGLSANATSFDCNWIPYAQSVVNRTIPALAGVAIAFLISCVAGLIIMCCCFGCIGNKKRFDDDDEDDDDDESSRFRDKIQFLVLIPIFLIIAGTVIALIGNSRFSDTVADAKDELRTQINNVKISQEQASVLLNALAAQNYQLDNQATLLSSVQKGVNDLTGHVDDFVYETESANTGRNVVLVVMTIGSIIVGIIGFILMKQHRKRALLGVLIVLNFFVFLAILNFTAHAVVSTAAGDICKEVDYQNGMFDLWQTLAVSAFAQLKNASLSFINEIGSNGCQAYDALCNPDNTGTAPVQICGVYQCGPSLYNAVANFTLIDDGGVAITVQDCATSCVNADLKNGAKQYAVFSDIYNKYLNLMSSLDRLLHGIASESTRTFLRELSCNDLGSALVLVYTGCGVLLAGQLLLIFFFFLWGW